MKTCPSCASRLDDSLMSCPSCGYEYPQEASSRTIMGFPAVTFPADAEPEEVDLGKQTLFGFPAQKASVESQFDDSEGEEDDATHLIPAADLQREFQDDLPQRAQVEELVKPSHVAPGQAPNIKAAWGLDEDSDDSRTAIVSLGSAMNENDEPAGFSLRQEEVEFPEHATLMGMNIADLEKKNTKVAEEIEARSASTQFAMPAVQFDTPVAPLDSGPISEDGGASTEMWNPSDDIPSDASPEQRALLEQLRSGTLPSDNKRSTQESAKPGGQILPSGGPKLGQAPAINIPNVDPSDLRARLQAKLRNSPLSESAAPQKLKAPELPLPSLEAKAAPAAQAIIPPKSQKDLSSQGVLGKSTYVISRQKDEGSEPVENKAPIAKLQLAQPSVPEGQLNQPEYIQEQGESSHGVLFTDGDEDDFAFADTNVAPSELVEKIQSTAPARVDGSATDIFDSVPDNSIPEKQPEVARQQDVPTRSSSFPEPSRPIIPTPYEFSEPKPEVVSPTPVLTAPENSAMVPEAAHPTPPTEPAISDPGPIWLQRIPAVLGALLLLSTGPLALVFSAELAGYFAAGVFSFMGIVTLATTFSGPPNLTRRTIWAITGLVSGGFGLMVLGLQIAPIPVGFPAFCGGLLTFGAAIIRTIYDRLPSP